MAFGHVDPARTKTHWNDADGATDIKKDSVLIIGDLTAVAIGDIPAGSSGEVAISEQWYLPKGDADIPDGKIVYWDEAAQQVTTTAVQGRLPCVVVDTRTAPEGKVGVLLNCR